jgi:hypothetical protein
MRPEKNSLNVRSISFVESALESSFKLNPDRISVSVFNLQRSKVYQIARNIVSLSWRKSMLQKYGIIQVVASTSVSMCDSMLHNCEMT